MKWEGFLLGILAVTTFCHAEIDDMYSNPFVHRRVLGQEGRFVLEWLPDFDLKIIYFNVSVQTKGFIGLGLSKNGLMHQGDIVIGGVHSNGVPYFTDGHGVDHKYVVDAQQDWMLLSAWESNSHTFLSFFRQFETCDDPDDIPINDDVLSVLWSFGERDDENYHYEQRGSFKVYLLDPDLTPRAVQELTYHGNSTRPEGLSRLGDWRVWSIPTKIEILEQETEYVCTFHKAPPAKSKQHIVGFRTVVGELENRHIQKLSLHACYAPKGVNPDILFGRYLGHPGEECYILKKANNRLPTQYCQEIRHVWSRGAGPVFFPDHVGLPLSETQDEFYLLQVHYDNPQQHSGITLEFTLEAFYTNKLRQYDAGTLTTGVAQDAMSLILPPSDIRHIIYGHCSVNCTNKIVPESGLSIFAGNLRTHGSGRGVRALLIHNLEEQAITADDNFTPSFQPIKIFSEEKVLMPGDQLVTRCVYDTTNKTEATVGGVRSKDEICSVVLWYYPRIRGDVFGECTGELRSDLYRNDLQIFQTSWSDEKRAEIVQSPQSNAGYSVDEVASTIHWDINKRTQLQTHHRFLPQVSQCPSFGPEAVTMQLLGKMRPDILPLKQYLEVEEEERNLTNINEEIHDPKNEFVSLWPQDLKFYSPPTTCLKT